MTDPLKNTADRTKKSLNNESERVKKSFKDVAEHAKQSYGDLEKRFRDFKGSKVNAQRILDCAHWHQRSMIQVGIDSILIKDVKRIHRFRKICIDT